MPRFRPTSRDAADPRQVLRQRAAEHRQSLAALSRMLRRPQHYLGRFVREGVPVALTARDHQLLADHFGVDQRQMGVRDLWAGD